MPVRVEPIHRWVVTCGQCLSALSYELEDIRPSASADPYIQCPACKNCFAVPDPRNRIPFQSKTFW